MSEVLIIGCGYAGARVAAAHVARGDRVTATTRAGRSGIKGVHDFRLDLDRDETPALPRADRLYFTAPPPATGLQDPRLTRVLDALALPPEIVVYFSTTGVYGDRAGNRVAETDPVAPGSDRARRRLDAERQLACWCSASGAALAILRIAGIYGPGRLPLARLQAGEPVPDPRDTGPGNRIHVEDLAAAALAVADHGRSGTWNASDGNPLSVAEFNDLVADAAGLPRPRRVPLDSSEISPGMRSFLRETRLVDNRKLLSLPGFRLRHADPVEGIRASMMP